jgi:hypothetical protein
MDVKPFIIKIKNNKGMNNPMKGIMKRKLEKKRPNLFGIVISNLFWCKIYILRESCAQKGFWSDLGL